MYIHICIYIYILGSIHMNPLHVFGSHAQIFQDGVSIHSFDGSSAWLQGFRM